MPQLRLWTILCLLVLPFSATWSQGQNLPNKTNDESYSDKKGFDINKVFVGGGLGFSFGTITMIDISPMFGYHFTPKLSAGAGFNYQHYRDKRYTPTYKYSVTGPQAFGRYLVLSNIYLHGEYQHLTYKDNFSQRQTQARLPLGGGFRQKIAGNSYLLMEVLYDVLYNQNVNSLYNSPLIIRGGVNIGL
ncbi:MAG: hypothetical protein R2798_07425 [Chitinophagales bacterium]|nr:hypothetical protein [Bacteroidota bacterium]